MAFKPAERRNSKLRLSLDGPAGSGKTYTMLELLALLEPNSARRGVIDSENRSSEKYAYVRGAESGGNRKFSVSPLGDKMPTDYIDEIQSAKSEGFTALGIDSLTHAWVSALEWVDRLGGWSKGGKVVSPVWAKLINSFQRYPGHVIATMRAKSDVVFERDEKTGKTVIKKLGMAAQIREGTEFEFDVALQLSMDGLITVSKTRCSALDGQVFERNKDLPRVVAILNEWLDQGRPMTFLETFVERVELCTSSDELAAALSEAKTSPEAKALTAEDKAKMKAAYVKRTQQLQAQYEEFA